MANLTITVDSNVLKKARIRALEQNTSVNAVLRKFLESYAGVRQEQTEAVNKVVALSNSLNSSRGEWRWNRDELHERG